MSEHRRPRIPFSDAPRGQCRWCGETILHESGAKTGEIDRRRRWHPACVDEYNASDPREARRLVRKRDRGICRDCRIDTKKLGREVRGRGRARRLRELGFKPRTSLWELDHVVPLIDGGGHGLDNLQTLCVPCHAKKSAREASERAASRQTAPRIAPPEPVETSGVAPPTIRREKAPELDALLLRADEANARASAALQRIARGEHP